MTLGEEQADEADTLALQDGGLALMANNTFSKRIMIRKQRRRHCGANTMLFLSTDTWSNLTLINYCVIDDHLQ